MEFLELAKKRCSIRSYEDRPVEKEKVDKILEAARVAPTAANYQPVQLIVVQKKEGLEKVSQGAKTFGAPLVIIVCADHEKAWVRPYDKKNTCDIDTSIVTDHMMLQAAELGLGSVWMCWFKPDIISREFELPEHLEPVNILAIGYGKEGTWKDQQRHGAERIAIEDMVTYR